MTHEEEKRASDYRMRVRADDPHLAVRARMWSIYGPIIISTALLGCMGVIGFVGTRLVNNFDALTAKVDGIRDSLTGEVSNIKVTMSNMQGQVNQLQQHTTDVTTILDSRVNNVSNWSQKNTDEINKLRDLMYQRGVR